MFYRVEVVAVVVLLAGAVAVVVDVAVVAVVAAVAVVDVDRFLDGLVSRLSLNHRAAAARGEST